MPARPSLVLDFDGSPAPCRSAQTRIFLPDWQERIRFGCSTRLFAEFARFLEQALSLEHGCVLLGSGDFHHLTLLLLARLAGRVAAPFDLVVADNHPDNMRYPWGIHCGSWVSHASALANIRHVHVIGITSDDITLSHAWENRLSPLLRKKLTYWSVGKSARWLRLFGRAGQCRTYASPGALLRDFLPLLHESPGVYLSVDKDVLHPDVVRTNWDQGVFREDDLSAVIGACAGKLVGADICGEVSAYTYKSWFKRLLARLDGQETIAPASLCDWQQGQHALNERLLALIDASW